MAATLDTTTDTQDYYIFDGTGLVQTLNRTDNAADFVTNPVTEPISYGGIAGAALREIAVGEAHIYQGTALSQGRIENIYNNTKARYGY